jgi:hypothetical protein
VAALGVAAEGATRERPLVLVIDELPHLLERDPAADADLLEARDRSRWTSSEPIERSRRTWRS